MATGTKKGLNPCRKVGSGPDNKGLSTYPIASGYGTALGKGDPVKLTTDGTIIKATNDTADSIGVFLGVDYTDAQGTPTFSKYWPASTVATNIQAKVMDDPNSTFQVKGEGPIPLVQRGDIFAMNLTTADTITGQSTATAKVLAEVTGTVDIEDVTDLGADITTISDTDTFTIRTSQVTAGDAVTITIADGDSAADLLDKLNAVDNITATYNSSGFLNVVASDGYDLVLVDGTGTPLANAAAAGLFAAGTITEVVAASAGLVKVVDILDTDTYALEVVLVDHDLRDDG